MNKMPRLSKSGIEYLDYMWGIWSGCYNWANGICPVRNCWAKGIATRFHPLYPNGFEPTFYPEALDSPKHLKKPSIIGVGWVGEVVGYSSPAVRIAICDAIKSCPQHTFLFLTKNPDKLIEWDFPDNCWVGVTATNQHQFDIALAWLPQIEASLTFLSIEPHLEHIRVKESDLRGLGFKLGWLIDGAQSNPYKPPEIGWVREIVEACDKAGIPVFLKDNLKPLLDMDLASTCSHYRLFTDDLFHLRQEMPVCQKPQ